MKGSSSYTDDMKASSNEFLPEWVKTLPEEEAIRREAWPPRAKHRDIPWKHSTHEVYYDPAYSDFSEDFSTSRQKLDYNYHRNPARRRQELQDVILTRVVEATESSDSQEEKGKLDPGNKPWLVFLAGPMGVGKGYVLSTLNEKGIFPLDRFLKIDPDMLKNELPEMAGYLNLDPSTAATKLHRESAQMADILLEYALQASFPAVVDGSLRDVDYYEFLIRRIREEFPQFQLAILHVTACEEAIRSRAKSRAKKTGRAVPERLLEESIEKVPKSVKALAPYVDILFTIQNDDDKPIQLIHGENDDHSSSLSWRDFQATWWGELGSSSDDVDLPEWCESRLPGTSNMEECFDDPIRHKESERAWLKAYPSFCPRCTLISDSQCGLCIHDRHLCECHECGQVSCRVSLSSR